jgi:hypothetical protein
MPDTESLNPRFVDIDSWPTHEAVEAMLEGQMAAISCIKNQTKPQRLLQAACVREVDLSMLAQEPQGASRCRMVLNLGQHSVGLLIGWSF